MMFTDEEVIFLFESLKIEVRSLLTKVTCWKSQLESQEDYNQHYQEEILPAITLLRNIGAKIEEGNLRSKLDNTYHEFEKALKQLEKAEHVHFDTLYREK